VPPKDLRLPAVFDGWGAATTANAGGSDGQKQ
jgi:hypothetical protein